MTNIEQMINKSQACLIYGAAGDALGSAVEFDSYDQIVSTFGPNGIDDFAHAYGVIGPITDDTQMTLMAADGLISAYKRGSERGILADYWTYVAISYIRWLETQGGENSSYGGADFWGSQQLFDSMQKQGSRAPGSTCISALSKMTNPPRPADNNSKGCGTVMRVAPFGVFFGNLYAEDTNGLQKIYNQGFADAAITHGHPTAQHASGVLAVIIAECLYGKQLQAAAKSALDGFGSTDVTELCDKAIILSEKPASLQNLQSLGEGWIAEEALAISLYCALVGIRTNMTVKDTLLFSVNHGGDSDSTGAITGNLLGIGQDRGKPDTDFIGNDTEIGSLIPLLNSYGEQLIRVSHRS